MHKMHFLPFNLVGVFVLCFVVNQIPQLFGQISDYALCQHNLTADNEPETTVWLDFQDKLEKYSGLQDNYTLEVNCTVNKICTLNSNGRAIWKARAHLYSQNMMFTTEDIDNSTTIDGCLCSNSDLEQYRTCMDKVRSRMLAQLETVYLPYLKTLIESEDCINYNENCLS